MRADVKLAKVRPIRNAELKSEKRLDLSLMGAAEAFIVTIAVN